MKNALFEDGKGAFKHSVVPYVIIVMMICCLLTQITILNKGLSRFNALLMVPVYQSFWNGSSVLGELRNFLPKTTKRIHKTNPSTQEGLFTSKNIETSAPWQQASSS